MTHLRCRAELRSRYDPVNVLVERVEYRLLRRLGDDMRRRDFIVALGGVAAAWPASARAQPHAGKIARIGFVGVVDNSIIAPGYPAFVDELKKSGFSEGQNLAIEAVRDIRDTKRFFAEAADLAQSKVDVCWSRLGLK